MHAGFDSSFRAFNNLGDLGDRQIFQKMQHENFPMP